MLDQLKNYHAHVYREELGTKLGKRPLYGQLGNCARTYYFRERN